MNGAKKLDKKAVCDIEACNWTEFACLGFFDGENYIVYWDIEGFLEFFLQRKYRGWTCYAHFGGKYDIRFFIPILVECGRYELKIIERNSKILSVKVIDTKNRHSWTFSDSYFILPASLEKLGKTFDIKYMKKDFDVESCKSVSDWAKPIPQEYLRNDCLGLYEILEKFSNWGMNGGVLKKTLPSQALHVFTTNFLTDKLMPLDSEEEKFIRQGYFGGRVEIFKQYGHDLYYYDVNSHYPNEMLKDMPTGRALKATTLRPDLIGFYLIEADIPEGLIIPPLPLMVENKLFFPVGKGKFYVTSADLFLLAELNIKFQIIDGIVFEKSAPIFKEYILSMWQIRKTYPKGSMDYEIAKLLMNTTYGKFGQKRDNVELIFSHWAKEGYIPFDEEFGLYHRMKTTRSKYILPYISSYITSLARCSLYRWMMKAGLKSVYYCDTDSIISSTRLPTGEGLGELKLEYKIDEAVFLQPKAYALKLEDGREIVKVKGFNKHNLKFDDFKTALFSGDLSNIKSDYESIMGFREGIRRRRSLNIYREKYHKQLNNFYDKRKIINFELTQPFNYININS